MKSLLKSIRDWKKIQRRLKEVIFLKVAVPIFKVYCKIKWSPWNPWAVAMLNLTWNHYRKSDLYKYRKEVDREMMVANGSVYKGDLMYDMFIQGNEVMHFKNKITRGERAKMILMPFSCGNRFNLPVWRISNWIFGAK